MLAAEKAALAAATAELEAHLKVDAQDNINSWLISRRKWKPEQRC